MKPRRLLPFTAAITCVLTISAHAVDRIKQNNTTALNLPGAWDTLPATDGSDVAVWNNTVTGTNSSALGGNVAWAGIRMDASPGGKVTITGADNTITLGSSGITLAGTQQFEIQSRITLAANQTWTVNNTPGTPLRFQGQNSNTLINLGGFTLDTAGTGAVDFNNAVNLSNGTINIGGGAFQYGSGGGRTATIASNVTLNVASGKTLVFNVNSGSGGIGINSSGAINLNGGTLQVNSTNNTRLEQNGLVSLGNGSNILVNTALTGANHGQARFLGGIGVAAAGTAIWTETSTSTSNTLFSGPLTGSGTLNVRNHTSTRQIEWSGDNSAFSGIINLDGSTALTNRSLRLTSANSGSALATWAPAANNTLQVDGVAVNLGTLNGAGTVTNSHASNAAKITVGAGAFSGAITNGAPTLGMSLAKNTAGTLTLTGANTYTGLTDIQGGTLKIGTGGSIASASISVAAGATFDVSELAPYTLANNVTLGGSGAVSGNVTDSTGTQLQAGGAYAVGTLTFNNDLNLSGNGSAAFDFAGPASADKIIVTGSLTPTATTNLYVSSQPIGGFTTGNTFNLFEAVTALGGAASNFNLVNNTRSTLSLTYTGNNVMMSVVSGVAPESVVWVGDAGANVWDANATSNWNTGKFYDDDNVSFTGSGSANSPVSLNTTVRPTSMTVDSSSGDYVISGSGSITGTTGIAKSGSSALTLATSNTFVGGVQLNAGTLNVNHANALGAGTLAIAGGTTLNNTSGSAKVATNAQNWNGDFTFTGSSDLTLGAATMNASCQVTVNGGTLTVSGVSGTGFGLTKAGAGTLALGSNNNTVGAVTLTSGSITGTGTLTGSSYAVESGTISVKLGGSGALTKSTLGTVTVSGAATYTGGTTVNAGRLTLVNTKTGSANFVTNAELELNVTTGEQQINGGTFSGTGNLIKSGTGLVKLGANLSPQTVAFTGANSVIDVQGGVLRNEYGNSAWGSNKAGLKVASGAVFDVWDGNTTVDELTGSGKINKGWSFNNTLTIGVNDGTGDFTGVILNNDQTLGYTGQAGGTLSLVKQGSGTQTLSGVNTYAGATTISGGTLALGASGSIDNTSGVSLGTNGTFDVSAKSGGYTVKNLTGSGSVKGALTVSTQLSIGNSPGTATFDSGLTLDSATYIYEMTGGELPGVGSADLANVTGTLNITAGSVLDLVELGTYTPGNKFTLFGYTTGIFGTFDGLADGAEFNDDLANKWQIDYDDTTAGLNGGIGTSFVTITAVPEPHAALLGGLGLLALLRRRRQ